MGRKASVLSSEKSNTLDMMRWNAAMTDSSSRLDMTSSPGTTPMLTMLLTYDFMSPHDLYSAVLVRLPVYSTSCNTTVVAPCTIQRTTRFYSAVR